jgi:23S rRNA (cytosine1962-C5)-methyltransferase
VKFFAPVNFDSEPRLALRTAAIEPALTNAFRVVHGASDGWPGWFVDKLGDFLLSQSELSLNAKQKEELSRLAKNFGSRGAYHKILSRAVRRKGAAEASPQLCFGEAAPGRFEILENGVRYELSFREGYSVGLFLDQRDNRRRLLTGSHRGRFFSNLQPPTCRNSKLFRLHLRFLRLRGQGGRADDQPRPFKKYLEWGKRNFALNGLDAAAHMILFLATPLTGCGDSRKKTARSIPSCSIRRHFRNRRNTARSARKKIYGTLVTAALPVLKPGGVLLASTNAADWPPENFLAGAWHYVPQPPVHRRAKRKILKIG